MERNLGPVYSAGAKELARALVEKSWTQQYLEEKLGLSRGQGLVSRWLSGDRRPGLKYALQLETLLNIPAADWMRPPVVS